MRAAVHDRYGDADVIRVDRRPVPAIADDEVLVRVSRLPESTAARGTC
jgi:NADPH:quinone reductase-like Zn-dependent oxidoreductase